ncbi:unnamed protein product [Gadus morhua 'NCC']
MSKAEKGASRAGAPDSKTATEVDALIGSDFPLGEYKMDHKRRGLALIFNQETFGCQKMTRSGTNIDRDNLEIRFKALNFDVQAHQDLTRVDILAKISEAAQADHVDSDCFVCVFLSHGENDKVWAHDQEISIDEVTDNFKGDKCRSLVRKPKIFILQACRGREFDLPVTGMAGDSDDEEEEQVVADDGVFHTLPAGADFLMCYSVAKGYFSFRDTINGSWYIQDLCKTLEGYGGSREFTELLTLVNSKVCKRSVEKSRIPDAIGKKQIPCFASMLTKNLFFRPKQ